MAARKTYQYMFVPVFVRGKKFQYTGDDTIMGEGPTPEKALTDAIENNGSDLVEDGDLFVCVPADVSEQLHILLRAVKAKFEIERVNP